MNKFLNTLKSSAVSFAKDEEGAQIVEYALIIAVVSIALVVALRGLTGVGGGFTAFITRLVGCLNGAAGALACT